MIEWPPVWLWLASIWHELRAARLQRLSKRHLDVAAENRRQMAAWRARPRPNPWHRS